MTEHLTPHDFALWLSALGVCFLLAGTVAVYATYRICTMVPMLWEDR